MRLDRAFGTSPEFWLNLQAAHNLRVAELSSGAALRAVKCIAVRAA